MRDLLRSHPAISIPPESQFIPRLYSSWGDPESDREATALARRILSLRTVRDWEPALQPSDFSACRSFAQVLEVLFGDFARRAGSPRWGDKTPQYVEHIPLLTRIFPQARVIHIYRDGRDVIESWVRMSFTPGNVFRGARGWRHYVRAGRDGGAAIGDRYHEVRYETLVTEPEATMRGVCEFIGEDFTEAVLTRAMGPAIYGPSARRRTPEISTAGVFAWKRRMALSDRTIIESVAGDLLAELGYALEGLGRTYPAARRGWWAASGTARAAGALASRRRHAFSEAARMARARVQGRLR